MDKPLVSVVITCFNRAHLLERSLGSCLQQSWPSLQIVFVDNNSTDGSADTARALARTAGRPIKVVRVAEQGMAHALRAGHEHATGEFCQWLDSDDSLPPGKIERQVDAMEAAGADCAYGDWRWVFHSDDGLRELDFPEREREDALFELLANRWRPPHAYLLRRNLFERVREIRRGFELRRAAVDREYFTLAALLNRRFVYMPGAPVDYHSDSNASQITTSLSRSEKAATLQAIFEDLRKVVQASAPPPLTPVHRQLLDTNYRLYRVAADPALLRQVPPALAELARRGVIATLPDHATLLVRTAFAELMAEGTSIGDALGSLRRVLGMSAKPTQLDVRDATALGQGPVPFIAPVLIPERVRMERALREFAERGVLQAVGFEA